MFFKVLKAVASKRKYVFIRYLAHIVKAAELHIVPMLNQRAHAFTKSCLHFRETYFVMEYVLVN